MTTHGYLNKLLKSNADKMQAHRNSHDSKEPHIHCLNQAERAINTCKSSFDETCDTGSTAADSKHVTTAKIVHDLGALTEDINDVVSAKDIQFFSHKRKMMSDA